MGRERLQAIVEIGLAVALCAAFNTFALYRMPQGGAVSLEMAPIVMIALRRGLKAGVVTGVLFGLVDLMIEPFVVHPLQFVLDYPLAFGLVGVAGAFAARWWGFVDGGVRRGEPRLIYLGQLTAILPAVLLASVLRMLSHTVSGALFFAAYAPAGQNAWLYSVIYNGAYLLPSALACAVALWIAQPVLDTAVPRLARAAAGP